MYKFELNDPTFLPHCGCDVEFNLVKGEGLIMVGRNGIGKSSLMRRIHSAFRPQHDIVFVDQSNLDFFYDRRLSVMKKIVLESRPGLLNQDFFLHCWNAFGLDQKENRSVSALSGGESQALKICCGLGREVDFLLLDEPSQFLDREKKQVLANLLDTLKKMNKALLLVEHDQAWLLPGWKVESLMLQERTLKKGESWTI